MFETIISNHSQTRVLTTADEKEWLEILQHCSLKDPHYLPGYLKIYEKVTNPESFRHFGGQACLFIYGDSQNFIIYPFFKRSIASLPFADSSVSHLFDIVSPYGYGGPLPQIQNPSLTDALWQGFFQAFSSYCLQNNIVSEFARLHPLFENHRYIGTYSQGYIERLRQVVYIDLNLPEEIIFKHMVKSHRRRIRRAFEQPDLTFETSFAVDDSSDFFDLYTDTMRKDNAHEKYFFPREFFRSAFSSLESSLYFWKVKYNGEIIAGILILHCDKLAYTWLSGARKEFYNLFPNNYLIYKSIQQLKQKQVDYLILGGGKASEEDSLFTFKAGFSPLRKDFYIYKKIYLPVEYQKLVEMRGNVNTDTGYFPLYRVPV